MLRKRTTKKAAEEITGKELAKTVVITLVPTVIKLAVLSAFSHAARRHIREQAKRDPYVAEMLKRMEAR